MNRTRCSIITPTWKRHDLLLGRCLPSVQEQTYLDVEHVIVSDGPDEKLRDYFTWAGPRRRVHTIRYDQLGEHDPEPHYGWRAQLRAIELATGDYIGYVDDDDALRPAHCALMAAALDADPEAGFAVSRMMCHGPEGDLVVGWGPLVYGNVGSPMIMHRRELTRVATWRQVGLGEDWDLVERWLAAGIRDTYVDAVTADAWPSAYREPAR